MKFNKGFILFVFLTYSGIIGFAFGQEKYLGVYYYSDIINHHDGIILDIQGEKFYLYVDSLKIYEISEDGNGDLTTIFPNYSGKFIVINDSVALLSDSIKNISFAFDISDTLCLKLLENKNNGAADIDFVRFVGYYFKPILTQHSKQNYKQRWTYGRFWMSMTCLMNVEDNYFYYYDNNGELLNKVKDSCKIHPYSRLID